MLLETKGTERLAEEVAICRPKKREIQDEVSFSVLFLLKVIVGERFR